MQSVGSTTPWMCRQLGNHDRTSTLSPLLRKVHCLISEHFSNRISVIYVMYDPNMGL